MDSAMYMPPCEAQNAQTTLALATYVEDKIHSVAREGVESPSSMMAGLLAKLQSAYRVSEGTVTEVQLSARVELSVKKSGRGAFLELAAVDVEADDIQLIWDGYRAYPKGALTAIADALGVLLQDKDKVSVSSTGHPRRGADISSCDHHVDKPANSESIWSPIIVGWKASRTQAGNVVEIEIEDIMSNMGRFRATLRCPSEKARVNYFDQLREAKETSLRLADLLLDFTE